jgi:hypothetical protein
MGMRQRIPIFLLFSSIFRLGLSISQKRPSSAPTGHLLPDGEGKMHSLSHRERVAEGRVRGQGRVLATLQLPNRTMLNISCLQKDESEV